MNIFAFADEAAQHLSGQIAAMQRNGLQGVELRSTEYGNVSSLTQAQAKEIHERLSDAGLTVWSAGSPLGKISMEEDFDAHLSRFRHTLDIAHTLGAKNIRLFSFYLPPHAEPEDYRTQVIDRLAAFLLAAEGSGIRLCHENEKGIYGDTAPRCRVLLDALPALRAVFDPANFIQCGQETLSAWELLSGRVEYLHIKDALPNGQVVPAGKGTGHLPEILSAFRAQGGTAVSVEPHLKVFSGLEALEHGEKTIIDDFAYPSSDAAFDAACTALKALL